MTIPVQIPRCACNPERDSKYDACRGEFYECTGCGARSDDPMPYAEPMDHPALDMTNPASWWFYCQPCAYEWILDGADVRRVVAPESAAA